MKMRPPSTPLITVDPYFSIWCPANTLTETESVHWTGSPNTIRGTVTVDGEEFRFWGLGDAPAMTQIHFDMDAMVTDYAFETDKIVLSLSFYSSLFMDDLYRLSRPVSYLRVKYESLDGKAHDVSVKIAASEELCINKKGEEAVQASIVTLPNGASAAKMGSVAQRVLWRDGDDVRIDWGYFYLAGNASCQANVCQIDDMTAVSLTCPLRDGEYSHVAFAYDDIHSLIYFEKTLDAYWKTKGLTMEEAIVQALDESESVLDKCRAFAKKLEEDATEAGGEKYAELLALAYRQVLAAHKLALDENGEVLFISKECFSNGCAATVDVTYPSAPIMLLYNIELLKGTLRPIFKFAAMPEWKYDFAPHDAGRYPWVNRQMYYYNAETGEHPLHGQMPVEECGNMLVLMANIALLEGNADFAAPHLPVLEQWVKYLLTYGEDPGNQLCTDDFAGHLAHNCNLSLKAIMGVAGFGKILETIGRTDESASYLAKAKEMANSWVERAANEDGSFRLAFDRPDTFSMKYNIVWDKLWGTKLFAPCVTYSEFSSYKKHMNPYGLPLDNRRDYTKSDWLVWTAMMAPTKAEFEEFIAPLWLAYHVMPTRVCMTDWYFTITSEKRGFVHRTVQGGLFIKLLEGKF